MDFMNIMVFFASENSPTIHFYITFNKNLYLGGKNLKILEYINIIPKISIIKTIYYILKFKALIIIGKGTILDLKKGSKILIHNGFLRVGVEYNLPQRTVLEIGENGSLIVNGRASFMKGSKIVIDNNAIFQIGNNSYVNEHSKIKCSSKITIGNNCAIAWNVNIIDTNVHRVITNGEESIITEDVFIHDNVWIGLNSIILKGVSIGEGSVIGAGSVVTKSIPKHSLSAGNPCKVIKQNIIWMP